MSAPLRRRDAAQVWSLHFGPNMTPMVDVVMVILVFFMSAAGGLVAERSLATAIPGPVDSPAEASSGDPLALPPAIWDVRLSVVPRAEGPPGVMFSGLGMDDAPIAEMGPAAAGLVARVGASGLSIRFHIEPGVPWDDVIRAHDLCRAEGIESIALMP